MANATGKHRPVDMVGGQHDGTTMMVLDDLHEFNIPVITTMPNRNVLTCEDGTSPAKERIYRHRYVRRGDRLIYQGIET